MGGLKRLRAFLDEVWKELKRTSWPSQREVVGTTVVVVFFTFVVAAYLWVVDLVLAGVWSLVPKQ